MKNYEMKICEEAVNEYLWKNKNKDIIISEFYDKELRVGLLKKMKKR